MPTVPQMPLPKRQQEVIPGQETAANISEMRGSFRAAASEASSRVLKKSFGALFSALRFRDKQEDYSAETRANFQNVSDSLDMVSDKVSYAVNILQDINTIQLKSLRLLREIVDGFDKRKSPSILDKLPKTLINLLKIAGLAGLAMARSRLGGLASKVMLGAGGLNLLSEADESINKNIEKTEPMSPDALAPKPNQSDGENDGGGGDEEDTVPELTALANEYESFVLGTDTEKDATETKPDTSPKATLIPTAQTATGSQITPAVASPVTKQNITATAPAPEQATANNPVINNNISANEKLTRSLVFSAETVTFSADEIEFIQKKVENVKSEEISKLADLDAEDDHVKRKKSETGETMDGSPGTGGTTPQGPAGSNPGNGSTPFNGPLNPDLGEIKTKSGLTTQVAKNMVPKFQGFVNDLESTGYNIRELGGFAMRRNVNNPSQWSSHAYGAAIDINASSNPNQSRQTDMPREQVQSLIQKHGLGWGLNWQSVGDPMHFSAMPNEGGTGVPNETTTPNQGGGATGGGSAGGMGGSTGGDLGAAATPTSKESATPGISGGSSGATPSGGGTGTETPSAPTAPQAAPISSTPAPANLTPPPVDTGFKIDKMSQNVSPLRPRASLDQILSNMSPQQNQQTSSSLSYFDPSKSVVSDPTKAGNVEPADADKRITELFGDYSSFGNVGSLN